MFILWLVFWSNNTMILTHLTQKVNKCGFGMDWLIYFISGAIHKWARGQQKRPFGWMNNLFSRAIKWFWCRATLHVAKSMFHDLQGKIGTQSSSSCSSLQPPGWLTAPAKIPTCWNSPGLVTASRRQAPDHHDRPGRDTRSSSHCAILSRPSKILVGSRSGRDAKLSVNWR